MSVELRFGIFHNPASGLGHPDFRNMPTSLLSTSWLDYLEPAFTPIKDCGASFLLAHSYHGLSCSKFPDGTWDFDLKDGRRMWRYQPSLTAVQECIADLSRFYALMDSFSLAEAINIFPPSVEVVPYIGPGMVGFQRKSNSQQLDVVKVTIDFWDEMWQSRAGGNPALKRAIQDGKGAAQDHGTMHTDQLFADRGIELGCEGYSQPGYPWERRISVTMWSSIKACGWPGPSITGDRLFLDTESTDNAGVQASGVLAAHNGMVPLFSPYFIAETGLTAQKWVDILRVSGEGFEPAKENANQ